MLLPTTKEHILRTDSLSIDAASIRGGAAFILLTTDAISLWHSDTLAQVHCIRRVTSSLESTGFNRRLVVRSDDRVAIVQTSNSVILVYDLYEDPDTDTWLLKSQDEPGIPRLWLKHRQNIRVEAGILGMCATENLLVLSTKRPAMVQAFHWQKFDGQTQTESIPISNIEFLKTTSTEVHIPRPVDILYSPTLDYYLWLTSGGDAFLVKKYNEQWQGHIIYQCQQSGRQAILAAFNDFLSILVIALASGEVITYKITKNLESPASMLCTYKCDDMIGSIRSITYSQDRLTLLVCGENGWTLRTSFGCKSYSNSIHDFADQTTTDRTLRTPSSKLRSAIWIQGQYAALFLPIDAEAIYVRRFCTVVVRSLQFSQSILLQEPEAFNVASEVSTRALQTRYTRFALPGYLEKVFHNFRYVVWSPCARFVAICGRHGLAHLSVASGIWKTYKNYTDNLQVELIVEPVWYHHYLIVAVSIDNSNYEIRLLSREFDLEIVLDTLMFDERPVSICARDGQVFVALANYTIQRCQILRSFERRITLQKVQQYTLEQKVLSLKAKFRSMVAINETIGDSYRAHLLFLCGTSLYYINLSLPEEEVLCPYPLADCVQWYKVIDGLSRLKNAVFVYDGSSLRLWFNVLTHSGFVNPYPEADVSIELDFIPVMVSGEEGLIEGFVMDDKAVSLGDITGMSGLRYQTRSFVPDVLEALLKAGLAGDAFAISTRFSSQPQFPYVLEVLLYKALEGSSENQTDLLSTTWKLLQKHSQLMPEVVVACARKSEISTWNTLFSVTGPPLQFYQESLDNSDLKTAGAYLMILLTLNAELKHKEYTLDLIGKAIAVQNWDLAIELARFYSVVTEDKLGAYLQLQATLFESEAPT